MDTRTLPIAAGPKAIRGRPGRDLRPGLVRLGPLMLCTVALSACVHPPQRRAWREAPAAAPAATAATAPALYFYPAQGQNEALQDRDRFECYRWARQQTGTDPGMAPLRVPASAAQRPAAPGAGVAVGAITGSVIGAAVASPRHGGEAMVLGALIGAVVGAAAEQAGAQERQQARDERARAAHFRARLPLEEFRRALSACMTGRGYGVG